MLVDSHRFNRIPEDRKAKLMPILRHIKEKQPLRIKQQDLELIFDIWNTDVYPDTKKMDSTCAICRVNVIGRLTQWAGV